MFGKMPSPPITEVSLHFLDLSYGSLVAPYEWSGGIEERFSTVLAEVHAGEFVGWGEAGFFEQNDALMANPALLEPWLESAAGLLLDQPLTRFRELGADLTSQGLPGLERDSGHHAWRMVRTGPLLWQPAAVAVEFALWDLFARHAGVPLRSLLGPGSRTHVPVCGCIGAFDPGRAGELARQLSEQGFRTIKLKVGGDLSNDLALAHAARGAVDDRVSLRLDPNGAYDVGTARRFAAEVEGLGVEYLEEPCAFDDLRGFAALRRATSVPIALDEATTSATRIAEIYSIEAADVLMLEFHQVGGVERLLQAAATAEACSLPLGLHTSYVTGVRTAAMLQFVSACPGIRYAPDTLYYDLQTDVLSTPLTMVGGTAMVPTGDGIGVSVDGEAVAAHSRATFRRMTEEVLPG